MKTSATILLTASIAVLSGSLLAQAIELNLAQNSDRKFNSSIFAAPPLPPSIGTPRQPHPGRGSRPRSCIQDNKQLLALVPAYSFKGSETAWAVTVTKQPSLWFYVPYVSSSADGKLVLENIETKQQTIHKVNLATKPGIIQVSLDDTDATLDVGQSYHWYFIVYCQSSPNDPDSFQEGNITRQPFDSALQKQVTQATEQQKVAVFARNGIWHEALTTAAQLHCADFNDSTWTQLLQAIGRSELASEPITTCRR